MHHNLLPTRSYNFYLIWGFWTSILILALFTNASSEATISYKIKKNINFFMPQGWGFFTRNPREAMIDAYSYKKGELKLLTVSNLSAYNWFGLSRKTRLVGFELSNLLGVVPEEAWKDGINDFRTCIPQKIYVVRPTGTLKNYPPGEYILHQYKPIPFSWASHGQNETKPFLVAHIRVEPILNSLNLRNL